MTRNTTRMPVAFVPHGGGPYSYVEMGMPRQEIDDMVAYWRSIGSMSPARPSALLVVSAHWEARIATVQTAANPPMLYDYYGFPPAAYRLQWPAPGEPALARRVREMLGEAGFETAEDPRRGFDHGTYVPFGRSFPDADIPTLQLSLKAGLDPEEHLAMGRALTPLRDEGVLILGSGMSYHNMQGFTSPANQKHAAAFDAWLRETVQLPMARRDARLADWEAAPSARQAHPRAEHLLPLMVIAGAAGSDPGRLPWRGTLMGMALSAVHFG